MIKDTANTIKKVINTLMLGSIIYSNKGVIKESTNEYMSFALGALTNSTVKEIKYKAMAKENDGM